MRAPALLPLFLTACIAAAPVRMPSVWTLASLDGQPFTAHATLTIDGDRAFGQAPCNTWSGEVQRGAFPGWRIRNLVATEMACDDLAAESAFFAALTAMTQAFVEPGHLDLADQTGRSMRFLPLAQ